MSPTNNDPLLLGVYLALYDRLNDDDEEIRDMAAATVSYLLSDPSKESASISLVPLAASDLLSEWLSSAYGHSRPLCSSALNRLSQALRVEFLGLPSDICLLSAPAAYIPVAETLAKARKRNTTMFAEEKQNLFINPVREAEIWARVLLQMAPPAVDAHVAVAFMEWTVEGLRALTDAAAQELDGPLGWTSIHEVFVLGMRVLLAAKVILQWELHVEGLANAEIVKSELKRLVDVGKSNALHELWLSKAEQLL